MATEAARCLPNLTGLSLSLTPPVPAEPTAANEAEKKQAAEFLKKWKKGAEDPAAALQAIKNALKNEPTPAKWEQFLSNMKKLSVEAQAEVADRLRKAKHAKAKKDAGVPEIIEPNDARLALVRKAGARRKEVQGVVGGAISDILVIKLFEPAELTKWHHEMKHAINTMAEFAKRPPGAPTLADSDMPLGADDGGDDGGFGCPKPSATLADGPQILCGGGFAALNNPGSFHNEFVRRLRRMVEQKAAIEHDVFGLDPAKPSEHTGWLLEQVVDRMLVRKPSQKVSAESWHRDIARGTHRNDKVYGGWLNLDLEGDQFFSCVPYTAYPDQAVSGEGFARLTPAQVMALEVTPCTAEHPLDGRKKIRIPPGHLILFNERTVHEVAPAPAPSKPMMRLFFGWRLSPPGYYFDANKKEFLECGSLYKGEDPTVTPASLPGDRTRRMPMVPDVLHRLDRQEGMPLKSGQHPDAVQPMLYPERVDGDLPGQAGVEAKLKHMDPRFKGFALGYGPPSLALEPEAQFRTKGGKQYYPQGPPNWPGAYLVTAEPKNFIIPLSQNLYAPWVPRIRHTFKNAGGVMAQNYPDGFYIVPQFFHGLKHYREEWERRANDFKAVHGVEFMGEKPPVYPDYEYYETQLHLPMTRAEIMRHLGMESDPWAKCHLAPPFYDDGVLQGNVQHLQRPASTLDALTYKVFDMFGMIQKSTDKVTWMERPG